MWGTEDRKEAQKRQQKAEKGRRSLVVDGIKRMNNYEIKEIVEERDEHKKRREKKRDNQ